MNLALGLTFQALNLMHPPCTTTTQTPMCIERIAPSRQPMNQINALYPSMHQSAISGISLKHILDDKPSDSGVSKEKYKGIQARLQDKLTSSPINQDDHTNKVFDSLNSHQRQTHDIPLNKDSNKLSSTSEIVYEKALLPTVTGKVGVLLASHGDIDNLTELECYTKTAVMKNRAAPIPDFSRKTVAQVGWLAVQKGIIEQYKAIGINTHYRDHSAVQAKALEQALRAKGIDAEVYYGFNFTKPFIANALEKMRQDGVENIVIFNQGAQYSTATGAENFRDVQDYFSSHENFPKKIIGIKEFSNDTRFRQLLADRVLMDIDRIFKDVPYDDISILLGSHGLPKTLQKKGDPATNQMKTAATAIKARLPAALEVKQGFLDDDFIPGVAWTHPTAEELADEIAQSGRKHILLDGRLSFTVHHRATLYDLNVQTKKAILERVPDATVVLADNFDGDPDLADLLADITIDSLLNQADIENIEVSSINVANHKN